MKAAEEAIWVARQSGYRIDGDAQQLRWMDENGVVRAADICPDRAGGWELQLQGMTFARALGLTIPYFCWNIGASSYSGRAVPCEQPDPPPDWLVPHQAVIDQKEGPGAAVFSPPATLPKRPPLRPPHPCLLECLLEPAAVL